MSQLKEIIDEENLLDLVTEFVEGLLRAANVKHAGNCFVVSELLEEYLMICGIKSKMINVKVEQGEERINHYLLEMDDKTVIDGTASQFKDMPKIHIGELPDNYQELEYVPA
jgi:hypothetical protein